MKLCNLLAELDPGDQAAIALDRVTSEIGKQRRGQDGADNMTGTESEFAKKCHEGSESQVIPPRQQKRVI